MIAATALAPSPFWYASRGSGFTALVLLTFSVLLGLLTTVRWHSDRWPRFLSQGLHRNVSLFALAFLVIHIVTVILDPFAGITIRDVLVPVGASYRPLWLGLGVIGAELFVAVLLTSLLRRAMSFRAWKLIHLLSYASWPVAVLHGIGTGTDTKSGWALLLTAACVAAVLLALVWRLAAGWPAQALLRIAAICLSLAAVVALAAWTVTGPLQPGWARLAGTPANLLTAPGASATAAPAASLPAGLDDQLSGQLSRTQTSATAQLDDQRDPTLHLTIVANADGSGSLTVTRSGQTICAAAATIGDQVTAQCGAVTVQVQVASGNGGATAISGTLITQASGG